MTSRRWNYNKFVVPRSTTGWTAGESTLTPGVSFFPVGGGTSTAPPLPVAVEEQLGLTLEFGMAPVEFTAIRSVERPGDN